jgi:hypothetical protein
LAITTALNYLKVNAAHDKLEKYDEICKNLQNDSKSYLSSLTDYAADYFGQKVLLMTGDTVNLTETGNSSLFFFFSPSECMSCVEENIFTLIGLAKSCSRDIYIVSTREQISYLRLLYKIHKVNSLHFGCFLGTSGVSASCYFMKLENGKMSNTYYPPKGKFESTQRYLDLVKEKLCSQNWPDKQRNNK